MSAAPGRKGNKPILSKQEFDAAFDKMIPGDLRGALTTPAPAPENAEPAATAAPAASNSVPAPAAASLPAPVERSEPRPLPESEGFSTLYAELKTQEGGAKADKLLGYATGLQAFDDAIGGLRPGSVTVIAGPSGSGKTALAKQLLEETIALEPLLLGFYFTLTDSPTQLRLKTLARLSLAAAAPLRLEQLSRGEIPSGTVERVAGLLKASTWVKRIYVMSCERGAEPSSLMRTIRRELLETRARGAIAVIDDLQHLAERRGKTSSEEALGQLVHELAREAARTDLHIVALFPLGQPADQGRLNEVLAEMGSVVWNASTVLVLPADGSPTSAIVIKDRFGKTPRAVDIHFHRAHSCFDSGAAARACDASPAAPPAAATVTLTSPRPGAAAKAEPPAAEARPATPRLCSSIEIPKHLIEVLESGGASVTGVAGPT
ncbi:MAG: DnaB-like helicase C-terminal domain-containing protein [Planctomycetota bacterium]